MTEVVVKPVYLLGFGGLLTRAEVRPRKFAASSNA